MCVDGCGYRARYRKKRLVDDQRRSESKGNGVRCTVICNCCESHCIGSRRSKVIEVRFGLLVSIAVHVSEGDTAELMPVRLHVGLAVDVTSVV